MTKTLLAMLVAIMPASSTPSAASLEMIRDVRRAIAATGTTLWPGFDERAVTVDLIDGDREYLICHSPTPQFTLWRRDAVTECAIGERRRVLDPDLSASFAVLPGLNAIAVGTPAALGVSAAEWRLIVLHEAFHQYQSRSPTYVAALAGVRRILGAKPDWVLKYAFPYDRPATIAQFARMNAAAQSFLAADSDRSSRLAVKRYVAARQAAAASVSDPDWLYYEFQVGQEGVARWTEITLGERMHGVDLALASVARDRRAGLLASLHAIDRQGLSVW